MNFGKSTVLAAAVFSAAVSYADETVLRVATEPSFAPFEFMDQKTSELVGFDVDIINAVAEAEGYKTNISSMPFDGQIPAVVTNQIDVAISGFTITDERKKIVNFSEPYYDAGLGALVRVEKKDASALRLVHQAPCLPRRSKMPRLLSLTPHQRPSWNLTRVLVRQP